MLCFCLHFAASYYGAHTSLISVVFVFLLLQHHCRVKAERSVLPRGDARCPDSQSDHGLSCQQVSRQTNCRIDQCRPAAPLVLIEWQLLNLAPLHLF